MKIYILMGVSGSGKSTVARLLAEKTGGLFLETDDFHSPANKEKMAAGIPLEDEDRWGWLDTLHRELAGRTKEPGVLFLACSALREAYRERLTAGLPGVSYIYLTGSKEEIRRRLEQRKGHFMSPSLLESQFETLEEPEGALVVSIEQPLDLLVDSILRNISPQFTNPCP